jgi:type I restriction enzyme S subunit
MMEGWELKKLGEVCEISTGKSNTEDAIENGQYSFFDRSKIIKKSSKYLLDCDAIIIAGEGQTFLPKFFSGKFDLHQRAYAIYNFNKNVSILYVYKYLIHFHKYFEEVAVGATAKSLRLRHFQDLPIPLPPLPEQQRIVAILDETFEAIAKAKENAEKNLKNAREIFEGYLQSVFANKGDGWEEKRLGEVSKIKYGYTEKASYQQIGPKFLRITDIQDNNVCWDTVPFCKIENDELSKYLFLDGDIVFARTGATTGKSFLLVNPPLSVFASYLIKLNILDTEKLSPQFLFMFFQTNTYWEKIRTGLSGSAQGGFNASKLSELLIMFPSIIEQRSIIIKLESLSIEIKNLEKIYEQKIADLDELKKSILQKAFSGEL